MQIVQHGISHFLFVSSISILAFALWFNFERPLGTNYYSSSEPSIFRCFDWYLAIESIGSDLFSTGSVLRVSNLIFFLPRYQIKNHRPMPSNIDK